MQIQDQCNLKEHDSVISIMQIEHIPPNTKGAIVHVYWSGVFEVEFFQDDYKSMGTHTVKENEIKRLI